MSDSSSDLDQAPTEATAAADPETETHLGDGEGLEIAHPEDFGVTRGADGELNTLKQRIPGTDLAVECKPLVDGAVDEWEDVLEGSNPPDDRVDEFLETHIAEGLGANGLEDVPDYVVPGLIEAVKRSSGYEVFSRIQESELEENLATIQAMDEVPEGLLETAMDRVEDDQPNTNGA